MDSFASALGDIWKVIKPRPIPKRSILPLNYHEQSESDLLLGLDEEAPPIEDEPEDPQATAEFVADLCKNMRERYRRETLFKSDLLFEAIPYDVQHRSGDILKYWMMPEDHPLVNLLSYNYESDPFIMYNTDFGLLVVYSDDAVRWCMDMLQLLFRDHDEELIDETITTTTVTPPSPKDDKIVV
jgi:hypothetical protein